MKRDSKDSHLPGGPHSSEQGEMHERDERLRDGSPAGSPSGTEMHELVVGELDGWSKDDFEAALPLYVGGDLDRAEATRVDAWLVAHPEDQKALAASEAAAGVLARFAQHSRQRETPDLWAGIRRELVRRDLLKGTEVTTSVGSVGPVGPVGSVGDAGETLAPILGGPRWFQRKSVAAAAALLLTGSAGLFMMSRGVSQDVAPAGGTPAVASSAGSPAHGDALQPSRPAADLRLTSSDQPRVALMGTSGMPIGVMSVGSQHDQPARRDLSPGEPSMPIGKTQRLRQPEPGAERLIDEASPVLHWQFAPWQDLQYRDLQYRGMDGAQLTSGR